MYLYAGVLRLAAALGHAKARRAGELSAIGASRPFDGRPVWIHAASAGEGNQALPLAAALRETFGAPVVISFSSPSGYDFHKGDDRFDDVLMLPVDSGPAARRFVDALNPRLAVMVRNEMWLGYLQVLNRRGIPAVLVNAPDHVAHRPPVWMRPYLRRCLGLLAAVFPVNEGNARSFAAEKIRRPAGDTKWELTQPARQADARLDGFARGSVCVVAGSTWPREEGLLSEWFAAQPPGVRLIVAPHEAGPSAMKRLERLFPGAVRYSSFKVGEEAANVLLLDEYGLLRSAYRSGHVAVVGGGFGRGIHNILEPAAAGLPVMFGPRHRKFPEAGLLADLGAAFPVNDKREWTDTLNRLVADDELRTAVAKKLSQEFARRAGYSERLARAIGEAVSR